MRKLVRLFTKFIYVPFDTRYIDLKRKKAQSASLFVIICSFTFNSFA